MKSITAHMIIKNEDNYVWFAIMSVIEYVDSFLIYDTGSSDMTVPIVESIINANPEYAKKIIFEKKGAVDRVSFAKLRQEQLERTKTDFFLLVDGDEIWWEKSIKELVEIANTNNEVMLVATKFINCAGDIYHYRDPKRDVFQIEDERCAITIRLMSMHIPGIHCDGYYGIEGYFDGNNREVQNNNYKTVIQNNKYLHTSYLRRSTSIGNDVKVFSRFRKLFIGYDFKFPARFMYPEVFYGKHPDIVEDPLAKKQGFIRILIHFFLDVCHLRNIIRFFRGIK